MTLYAFIKRFDIGCGIRLLYPYHLDAPPQTKIARMLAIHGCVQLAAEQVFERDDLHVCIAELIFNGFEDGKRFRIVQDAVCNRRGFDLDLSTAHASKKIGAWWAHLVAAC